jgi:hypothetical protein
MLYGHLKVFDVGAHQAALLSAGWATPNRA